MTYGSPTRFIFNPLTIAIGIFQIALFFLLSSCGPIQYNYNSTIEILPQFSDLQSVIDKKSNTVLVLNFWATSCPPCIKEMPHFSKLEKEYPKKDIKVLLISLDRVHDLDNRVYPFVKKYQIDSEVAILQDQNYSAWTEKIDSSWYGALPATLIIKNDQRKFRFGAYERYEDLKTDLEEFLY